MSSLERPDDFAERRRHLQALSDAELHAYFWELAAKVVVPLVAEARTHTSPAIERSVLLRMGFSSAEAGAIVARLQAAGVLGHGAGRLVLELAHRRDVDLRTAGLGLADGTYPPPEPR